MHNSLNLLLALFVVWKFLYQMIQKSLHILPTHKKNYPKQVTPKTSKSILCIFFFASSICQCFHNNNAIYICAKKIHTILVLIEETIFQMTVESITVFPTNMDDCWIEFCSLG